VVSGFDPDSGLPEQLEKIEKNAQQRAEYLDESILVRDMKWPQIISIAVYWQVCRAAAGCVVIAEGTHAPLMGVVISGQMRAEKLDSTDTPRELARFGKGRIFGELAMMDGEPASASVVADSESTLLVLTAAAFEKLRADHPPTALIMVMTIARQISQKLRSTSGRLVDLM